MALTMTRRPPPLCAAGTNVRVFAEPTCKIGTYELDVGIQHLVHRSDELTGANPLVWRCEPQNSLPVPQANWGSMWVRTR